MKIKASILKLLFVNHDNRCNVSVGIQCDLSHDVFTSPGNKCNF